MTKGNFPNSFFVRIPMLAEGCKVTINMPLSSYTFWNLSPAASRPKRYVLKKLRETHEIRTVFLVTSKPRRCVTMQHPHSLQFVSDWFLT